MRLSWKSIAATGAIGTAAAIAYAIMAEDEDVLTWAIIGLVTGIALPVAADALDVYAFAPKLPAPAPAK